MFYEKIFVQPSYERNNNVLATTMIHAFTNAFLRTKLLVTQYLVFLNAIETITFWNLSYIHFPLLIDKDSIEKSKTKITLLQQINVEDIWGSWNINLILSTICRFLRFDITVLVAPKCQRRLQIVNNTRFVVMIWLHSM